MNKKLIAVFVVAIFAVSAYTAFADTWIDKSLPLTYNGDFTSGSATGTTDLVHISIYEDCALTTPATGHDFGNVFEGNTYEWAVYVTNDGAEQVYLSYSPTTFTDSAASAGQVDATIKVTAIAYGLGCETSGTTLTPPLTSNALPYNLPEKNAAAPTNGFLLMPGKVVKLDVQVTVLSIDQGVPVTIPFAISGVGVTIQV